MGFNKNRQYDAESGLYHSRARAYSADIGRFLQQDPAGMIDGPNMYAYVGNNPVNRRDPSGMWYIRFFPARGTQPSVMTVEVDEPDPNPIDDDFGLRFPHISSDWAADKFNAFFDWAQSSGGGGTGSFLLMAVVYHISGGPYSAFGAGPRHR